MLYALTGRGRLTLRVTAIAVVLTMLYALSDEVHQAFAPDRSGRVDDLGVDGIGALLGVGIAWLVLSRLAPKPRPQR